MNHNLAVKPVHFRRSLCTRLCAATALAGLALMMAGCASLGASGPGTNQITSAAGKSVNNVQIKVIDVTDGITRKLLAANQALRFSETLGDGRPYGAVIGRGDVLDISIWEAPPAVLFGSSLASSSLAISSLSVAREANLPEQMVSSNGRITIPFAGELMVAGRTPQEIERMIVGNLSGKAHQPQAVVRLVRNATATVTVVGDTASSLRVPLTPKAERLLDILASAGGVKQPVGKMTIQVSREGRVAAMPLEGVIKDPAQNIVMQPNDVVTALFQPYSFTALGATGANTEVNYEGTGLTLAQALGRVGGLRDDRANIKGVFLFRLEDPAALDGTATAVGQTTPDGRVPVIYRVNLADPTSFFVAQSFPIKNRDVLYVSNAPFTDVQKFMNLISSVAITGLTVSNAVK